MIGYGRKYEGKSKRNISNEFKYSIEIIGTKITEEWVIYFTSIIKSGIDRVGDYSDNEMNLKRAYCKLIIDNNIDVKKFQRNVDLFSSFTSSDIRFIQMIHKHC